MKSHTRSLKKNIKVVNREDGKIFSERVYGETAMKIFYGSKLGAKLTDIFLTNRILSKLYGFYNDSFLSKRKIPDFISKLKINTHEILKEKSDFQSFNDFFARKLKTKDRPIDKNTDSFISPSDGRLLVFENIKKETISYVKWSPIKLFDLFNNNKELAHRYKDGSCGILRLCPSDYHRFHFPISGKALKTHHIKGLLHSVSPYALERNIPVFCLNKRTLCDVETENYGKVLLMEVGAMFVGSIVQTYKTQSFVNKGDEKGYFKFGGSTCIFFTEKSVLKFDDDLVENSKRGLETLVKFGTKIGQLKKKK